MDVCPLLVIFMYTLSEFIMCCAVMNSCQAMLVLLGEAVLHGIHLVHSLPDFNNILLCVCVL